MNGRSLLFIVVVAALAALLAVVTIKLLGVTANPGVTGAVGGALGGAFGGAAAGTIAKRRRLNQNAEDGTGRPEAQAGSSGVPSTATDHDVPIRITHELPAPPERVFRALTHPADIDAWMWGETGRDPESSVDLRPGGAWSASVQVDDPQGWPRPVWCMRGMYVVVAPPRRLVYTLHWNAPVFYNQTGDDLADEVVFIDLEPTATGTTLRYEQRGVPSREAADAHEKAVRFTFGVLAKHLERTP